MHPKFWNRIVTWSRVPENQRVASYGASLQFIPLERVEERYVPDLMELELLEQLKKVKARSNDLATWEMRSLSVEDTNAMLGILTMALPSREDGFRWKFCSGTPSRIARVLDSATKKPNSTRSVDASKILHFLEEPGAESLISTDEDVFRTLDSPESILDDSLRRGGSSLQSVREDIYSMESEPEIEWESESETETAARAASTARKIEEMPWSPPGAGHVASQELIQKVCRQLVLCISTLTCKQAWGQSVRQNSTLLVLHAGNYEYICIRHRETQTLYISDILHIPFLKDLGYGKVQVAIYLTALDDGSSPPVGVASGSLTRENPDASEHKNIVDATMDKQPRSRSRGRSNKGQRTMDLEVGPHLPL